MIGKMRWQRMFEMLHRIGIRGLNYYRGHTVQSSGAVSTMRHVFAQLQAKGVARPMVFDVGANARGAGDPAGIEFLGPAEPVGLTHA